MTEAEAHRDAEPKRHRVFRVSHELLAEVLLLPPGTKVVATADDAPFGRLLVKIEHPDFPPVPAGHAIPEVQPRYTTVSAPKFVGWGDG